MKIPFRISKSNKRLYEYYLRRRYKKPRAEFLTLAHIAIKEVISDQAKKELDELSECSPQQATGHLKSKKMPN